MAVGEGNVLQVARGVADGADALEDRLRVIVEERVDERQFAAVLEQVRVRAPALLLTDAMHTLGDPHHPTLYVALTAPARPRAFAKDLLSARVGSSECCSRVTSLKPLPRR